MQSCCEVLMTGELVLAGHAEHCVLPSVFLYVPAGHGVHASQSQPEKPLLHKHPDAKLSEDELPGQFTQGVGPPPEYFPGKHPVHKPPFCPEYPP